MTNSKWLAAALCAALVPHHAAAQSWPTKPVRFLTGFGVGGSSDQIARMIASQLSISLGQQVIVDSRPGGNGVAGTALAAKAPADGYTYLVCSMLVTNPSLQSPSATRCATSDRLLFASSHADDRRAGIAMRDTRRSDRRGQSKTRRADAELGGGAGISR
jgi:tripartite-type tricarboxylate transporter receptor subunit TctC